MNPEDVRRQWAKRSGEFSPTYYTHRGPDGTSEAIRALLDRYVDRGASILELGCSSGRHLAYLQEAGFRDLTGIEVNGDALAVMEEAYPDLAASGTFHVNAIENVLDTVESGAFAAVYSVETLQHVHPDSEWVFAELVRITDTLLITVENEGDERKTSGGTEEKGGDGDPDVTYVDEGVPLYYRNWRRVFTDLGFVEVETQSGTRDTLRAFRPAEE